VTLETKVTCLRCLRAQPATVYETRGGRVAGNLVCQCGYHAQAVEGDLEGLIAALEAPPIYDEEFVHPLGAKVSWKAMVRGVLHGHYGKVLAHVPPFCDAKVCLGSPYLDFGVQVQRVSRNPRYLVLVKRGRWGDAKPRLYSPTKNTIEHPRSKKKAG